MRRFFLIRAEEPHEEASYRETAAEGVIFACGKVVICWMRDPTSVSVYESLQDLIKIQEKNRRTRIQWVDSHNSVRDDMKPRKSGAQLLEEVNAMLAEEPEQPQENFDWKSHERRKKDR